MLAYLINVSLTWIILFVIYKSLLESEKYFKLNRFYLLSSLVLGLLLPLVSYIPFGEVTALPIITSELNYTYQEQLVLISELSRSINSEMSITESSFTFSWISFFQLLYFLGFTIVAIRMITSVTKLVALFRKSIIVEMPTHSEIVVDDMILPFSFMRYIFISAHEYNSIDRSNILRHELYHVKARHSIDVLCIELLKMIFWWNPMVYLYKQSIAENHEYAADEAVLIHSSRKQYCELLMKKTFPNVNLELTNPFFQTFIKKRITMMYQSQSNKYNLLKYSVALFAIIFIAVIFVKPIKAQTDNPIIISSVSGLEKSKLIPTPIDISEVTVTQEGTELVLGEDYKIDGQSGKLKVLNEEILKKPVTVKFEKEEINPVEASGNSYNNTAQTDDCKVNEYGVYYYLEHPSRLPSCPVEENGWEHSMRVLSDFAKANFNWPQKAIEEGSEKYMSYSIAIDEKGNLAELLPSNFGPYLNGLDEEGQRIIDLMRKEFKFIPAECNGKPVKTGVHFSLNLSIPKDKQHLVKIKDSKNVIPKQDIMIRSITSEGNLSFHYRSNMNVGVSFEVKDPEGHVIFTDSRDYLYRQYMKSVPLLEKRNGTYTVIATQDGVRKEEKVDVTLFSMKK
jgi:hypothetical protein